MMTGGAIARAHVTRALRERYGARGILLTDSGTSALVLALRILVPDGGTVALPGFACIDLAAAVRFAGVRVRLYDQDPRTLSPDLDSLEATLRRGVDAILVAHLYGYPADMSGVAALASRYGVPVIEDAAQGAGGTLHGVPLGAAGRGTLTVLSFGRGKGTSGGAGGALLGFTPEQEERMTAIDEAIAPPGRGARVLAAGVAQWALGRPSTYAVPASIPMLRLGEMVYHPAHEPRRLTAAAAGILRHTLTLDPSELATRRANAERLTPLAEGGGRVRPITPIPGGKSGFLRLAVLATLPTLQAVPRLGVMRGYPRALAEQDELLPSLHRGEVGPAGARSLREALLTLPTHSMVAPSDIQQLAHWLGATSVEARNSGADPSLVSAAR
jgi:perosamine synthetase